MTSIIRWATENQAAQLVNRRPSTLQAWRRAGEVVAYRQGQNRMMYFTESLIECQRRQRERYENRPNPGRPPNQP